MAGYTEALLSGTAGWAGRKLGKAASKKSLWGSVGRTLGGIAATVLTGGAAAPWAVGLMAGAGTFLGGAIGAKASGEKLTEGKYFKGERKKLQRELGAFGSQNIVSSLKSGLTAGIGQKLELSKLAGKTKGATPQEIASIKRGKGFDFKESMAGKGYQNIKSKAFEMKHKDWIDPSLQSPDIKIGGKSIPTAESSRSVVAMSRKPLQESYEADIARTALGKPPTYAEIMSGTVSGPGFQKGITPGHGKIQYDIEQAKSATISEGLKDYQFGPDTPSDTTRGYFDADELYDWDNDMADVAVKSGGERITAYDLQKRQRHFQDIFNKENPPIPWGKKRTDVSKPWDSGMRVSMGGRGDPRYQ